MFTSTVSSLSPPLCCYSLFFFFPISESGLRSRSQMRFGGQGLRALPPLQIEVSYCRLHAGINHLRFPTPLNQAATHWKEGGRTDSVSYFLPLRFFHLALFLFFCICFVMSAFCFQRQDVWGVWLTNIDKNLLKCPFWVNISGHDVSGHSQLKVVLPQQMFLLNSSTKYEMWAVILFHQLQVKVKL